jgi:hypothetical protein
MASPIPLLAPVTTATLPSRDLDIVSVVIVCRWARKTTRETRSPPYEGTVVAVTTAHHFHFTFPIDAPLAGPRLMKAHLTRLMIEAISNGDALLLLCLPPTTQPLSTPTRERAPRPLAVSIKWSQLKVASLQEGAANKQTNPPPFNTRGW